MRLVCIECAESIPAENINVQDLVAVCPVCDTVFGFNPDEIKSKHRKIKPPEGIKLYDDAPLHLSYERVPGSATRSTIIGIGFATMMLTFVLTAMVGGYLAGDMPIFVPIFPSILWLTGLYTLAMLYFTRTQVISDGQYLRVLHQFLPHPLQQKNKAVAIQSIESIFIEESYSSKRRGDAERSFHIYAETYDGGRALILKDVLENYALYIQQEVSRQIEENEDLSDSRLILKDETPDSINDYENKEQIKSEYESH